METQMLGIYFPEDEQHTSAALAIGKKLRDAKVAVNFRNANFFSTDPSQTESFDAVLCIKCDSVADHYAEKGTKVFRSVQQIEDELFPKPKPSKKAKADV